MINNFLCQPVAAAPDFLNVTSDHFFYRFLLPDHQNRVWKPTTPSLSALQHRLAQCQYDISFYNCSDTEVKTHITRTIGSFNELIQIPSNTSFLSTARSHALLDSLSRQPNVFFTQNLDNVQAMEQVTSLVPCMFTQNTGKQNISGVFQVLYNARDLQDAIPATKSVINRLSEHTSRFGFNNPQLFSSNIFPSQRPMNNQTHHLRLSIPAHLDHPFFPLKQPKLVSHKTASH